MCRLCKMAHPPTAPATVTASPAPANNQPPGLRLSVPFGATDNGACSCLMGRIGVTIAIARTEVAVGAGVGSAAGVGVRVGGGPRVGLGAWAGAAVTVAVAAGVPVKGAVGVLVGAGSGKRSCQTVTLPSPLSSTHQVPMAGRSMRQTSSRCCPARGLASNPWSAWGSSGWPPGPKICAVVAGYCFQMTRIMLASSSSTGTGIRSGSSVLSSAVSSSKSLSGTPSSRRTMAW